MRAGPFVLHMRRDQSLWVPQEMDNMQMLMILRQQVLQRMHKGPDDFGRPYLGVFASFSQPRNARFRLLSLHLKTLQDGIEFFPYLQPMDQSRSIPKVCSTLFHVFRPSTKPLATVAMQILLALLEVGRVPQTADVAGYRHGREPAAAEEVANEKLRG